VALLFLLFIDSSHSNVESFPSIPELVVNPVPAVPVHKSNPIPNVPPTPAEYVPPIDFDMNTVTQISSFPFSSQDSDHSKMLSEEYKNDAYKDKKNRIVTPLVQAGDGTWAETVLPGLQLSSAFYRNLPSATRVQKITKGCTSTSPKPGQIKQSIIFEPAFPSRVYCESCQGQSKLSPTEFFHLTDFNQLGAKTLEAFGKVSYDRLLSPRVLSASSRLPLGAWADPQYSHVSRMGAFNEDDPPKPDFEYIRP
ncbi:hypothetical protein PFISCL1PPCAC_1699, partial [Pristionchus fissidentatus]